MLVPPTSGDAPVTPGIRTVSSWWLRPAGIASTGDPVFAVPSSLLGVPALSLPLLESEHLPLGLQMLGFRNADAALFAVAAYVQGRHGLDASRSAETI